METAIWFWKTKVHNISDVLNGHFGASTKAIVSKECGNELNNQTDIAMKRYQRFVDCLKVCNYTNNDYSEKGCYPLLKQMSKISLIVIYIIAIVLIVFIGSFAFGYYFVCVMKKSENQNIENKEEQYDDIGKVEQYESFSKEEKYEEIAIQKEC